MRDLSELRKDIDRIDNEIKQLYFERLDIAREVAEYKIANNKPVFDLKREQEKIEKLTSDIEDIDLNLGVASLFNKLMADSRKKQYDIINQDDSIDTKDYESDFKEISLIDGKNSTIYYQGEPGAYSQAAANEFFGNPKSLKNATTWRDAMEAVKSGEAQYCVLPIENSTAGSVTEIYDLLTEYDLTIVGEQVIPIEHTLLGVGGSSISDIKTVYSHPQALQQCDGFFQKHPNIIPVKMLNTAAAAKKVFEDNDKTQAAIAGKINAEIYSLDILQNAIQDEDNNMTRFIILSREREYLSDAKKLSISFCLKHEKGSLYNALSYLSDNDINLSLIESRPIKKVNWQYRFFIDMEGNLTEKRIRLAIAGLNNVTKDLKILGNY